MNLKNITYLNSPALLRVQGETYFSLTDHNSTPPLSLGIFVHVTKHRSHDFLLVARVVARAVARVARVTRVPHVFTSL